jgi:hypothetical protein
MKIQPVFFNYGEFVNQEGGADKFKIHHEGRVNVLLQNERYTLFGELVDKEAKTMMLKDFSVRREYMNETKENLVTEWDSYLGQFADEEPAEITKKREKEQAADEKRKQREEEKAKKDLEKAEKALAKAKELERMAKEAKAAAKALQGNNKEEAAS